MGISARSVKSVALDLFHPPTSFHSNIWEATLPSTLLLALPPFQPSAPLASLPFLALTPTPAHGHVPKPLAHTLNKFAPQGVQFQHIHIFPFSPSSPFSLFPLLHIRCPGPASCGQRPCARGPPTTPASPPWAGAGRWRAAARPPPPTASAAGTASSGGKRTAIKTNGSPFWGRCTTHFSLFKWGFGWQIAQHIPMLCCLQV